MTEKQAILQEEKDLVAIRNGQSSWNGWGYHSEFLEEAALRAMERYSNHKTESLQAMILDFRGKLHNMANKEGGERYMGVLLSYDEYFGIRTSTLGLV